jgi:hypothetical protein
MNTSSFGPVKRQFQYQMSIIPFIRSNSISVVLDFISVQAEIIKIRQDELQKRQTK